MSSLGSNLVCLFNYLNTEVTTSSLITRMYFENFEIVLDKLLSFTSHICHSSERCYAAYTNVICEVECSNT